MVVLLSGEVWLLLFHCLFVFLLSFDCFVFSLFQTAGSASFIRLIDDGQCGYMENRICLNSRILLAYFNEMREMGLWSAVLPVLLSCISSGLGRKAWCEIPVKKPGNLKLGKGSAMLWREVHQSCATRTVPG